MSEGTLSPREIIEQLDVETIDNAINDLTEEINALRALRKVAAAKNGKAPASASNRGSNGKAKTDMSAILDKAADVLQQWGPLPTLKLANRVGYGSARWLLQAIESDSRFSIARDSRETIVSLA